MSNLIRVDTIVYVFTLAHLCVTGTWYETEQLTEEQIAGIVSLTKIHLKPCTDTYAHSVDPGEIGKYKESFRIYDKDGNGKIKLSEIGAVMRTLGLIPTEANFQYTVRINKENGTLDFPECLILMAKVMTYTDTEDKMTEACRIFDKDGDGFIGIPELRNVMRNVDYKLTETEIDDIISKATVSGDGQVNYKEFVQTVSLKYETDGSKKTVSYDQQT